MKKLFSVLALVAALTFATNNANAQESFGSAGLEVALPLGDFADTPANLGIGGSGTFEIGLSDNLSVMAHAGVLFYATDDLETVTPDQNLMPIVTEVDYSVTQIPIQLGARYYLTEQKDGLFISALVGVHITSIGIEDESESSTDLSFAPELGYFVTENISVSARFQFISTEVETINETTFETETENQLNNYVGVRVAYNF